MRRHLEEPGDFGHREALRVLGRALRYVAPFRGRMVLKGVFLVVSLLPLLFLPWPVKIVVDHVLLGVPVGDPTTPYPALLAPLVSLLEGRGPLEILAIVVGVQLGLVVLLGAVGTGGAERDQADAYLASGHDRATRTENEANAGFSQASGLLGLADVLFTIRLTQALNHRIRSRLFERLQRLPMASFDEERIGDAVYRVMADTPSITTGVYRILLTPVGSLVMAAATIAVIHSTFGAHPPIVWTAVALLGISLVATAPFARALRRRASRSRRTGAATTATLEEGLSQIVAVQSLGAEARARRRFDHDSWASFTRHRAHVALVMGIALAAGVPGLLAASHGFSYAAGLVIDGRISIGDFGLLLSYFLMLTLACVELGALFIRVQDAAVGLDRVFFLMDLPGEEDPPGARDLPPLEREIRAEEVSYTHPDGTRALSEVSLCARRNEVLALVGPAGAGKTTLAWLLAGFAAPTRGRILYDGHDLARATRRSVRDQVAFVFQETTLFDATVEENLRLGCPDASPEAIWRALEIAGADAFVRRLPEGIRTRLGRGGGKLSVGQKQRLAIARALVRPSRLLVLDEPTSALDPETEARILAALREAAGDRVVVVITHRLSTVRMADQILFLEDGRVRERGSHEALMALPGGAYRRFVELQTRGAA